VTARRRTTTTRIEVSSDRGVFMISVAAELADMHPQTPPVIDLARCGARARRRTITIQQVDGPN
jgi:hypothetical protein